MANSVHAIENSGQLKVAGSTRMMASRPSGRARSASAMKTPSARTQPMAASAQGQRGVLRSLTCVASVPHTIINAAMLTGASTGPHHGSGSRNRMSQSSSEWGQPLIGRRNT